MELVKEVKKLITVALHKDGLFTIQLVGKKYKVCYEASHYHEERDYAIIKALAKGRRCIFDVGANVGTSTLLLTESNDAIVHAFEASEFASNVILRNVSANNLHERVRVINTLVTDKTGSIIPFYWALSSGGASIYKGRLGHDFIINKMTLALDDYVTLNKTGPDLVKIDVEGAELLVLQGASRMLKESKPLIFLELHSVGDQLLWQNAAAILELIKKSDYKMIYLKTREPLVNAETLKERGRCHVLLMPADQSHQQVLENLNTEGL